MTKSDYSSFWTTGIWVLLRYLALPILIATAVYTFGGPQQRSRINYRLYAFVQPLHETYLEMTGRSDLLKERVHVRDPDLADASVVKLDQLPIAATVPVVNLRDLPELEGPGRVRLNDLPEPVEDTVVFLLTRPEAQLAVTTSPRPHSRPLSEEPQG
ncbi:hypothetical protein [Aliiruegeria sabulilitoris]|uniref:hypothetical protein n=1 Tax=Aliiruegeria sabulilitoris TaxID=1510458 RepID=UPI00082DBBCC|nr:hypothetical protein [Aliiruegeria sabulilitoris]NDR59405.1 hypothetical protein [Pseudoruegeria sp. M32A2M]